MRPPTIGLVGGIGAGKSSVARILAGSGCVVCDSDALAREALDDPSVAGAIRERWGESVFRPGTDASGAGALDRRAVAALVFERAEERRWLESVIHPWIERRRRDLFRDAPADTRARVIDAPLLLEAGLDDRCDAILFVDAPRVLRLARLAAARGWTDAELARREAAQWPLDRKRQRATHVIENVADESHLRTQVLAALDAIAPRSR
ncbi:MAG TPA: dephospho-CoA kinase [Phycisphaerales bacterium]|nr:dephospho-CoA kinase [Phycisphaerales bacterium]HMP38243.1 dephospho-CoA kinase [Phycisphaerales bacterium]